MGRRIYIAGPMESAGGNWNFPLFDYVAGRLRDLDCEVYNPADRARDLLGSLDEIQQLSKAVRKDARRQLMQDELNWICQYAQMLFMLPGWEQSPGARAEWAVAVALGKQLYEPPHNILLLPDAPLDLPEEQADK